MIDEIYVKGYRSLYDLRMRLGRINVISGANGSGKSNAYKALLLLSQSARGRLAESLALEGGMPSVLWAGPRRHTTRSKQPVRMTIGFLTSELSYEISCGLPKNTCGVGGAPSHFALDPEVKEEAVWYGRTRRPSTTYMQRENSAVWVKNADDVRVSYPFLLIESESVLAQLSEPHHYPELSNLRQEMASWRFYHHFRTDAHAPARFPQTGVRTPIIADDGSNLAAALETIREVGDLEGLNEMIDEAFPGCTLAIRAEKSRFEVLFSQPNVNRMLEARELSDGTLRYLCLLAALLTPCPPKFLVLNEPETSLHPVLIKPLARLIKKASHASQVWVTTHSSELLEELEGLCADVQTMKLEKIDGRTEISEPAL